jgi:hypothetical protein
MNKFIILVLAFLSASTLAFKVKQGGPGGAPREGGELGFPCEFPADDATEQELEGFSACLDEVAIMFDDFSQGACGAFPEMEASDQEAEAYFTCIIDLAEEAEKDTGAIRRVQHKRRIQQNKRRMQNKTRRN